MLMAGKKRTGHAREMRLPRSKMGWNRAAGAHQGGQGGDHAAMVATAAPFRLPFGPVFGYLDGNDGRKRRPNGKCRTRRQC
jgi:hypothetical protein